MRRKDAESKEEIIRKFQKMICWVSCSFLDWRILEGGGVGRHMHGDDKRSDFLCGKIRAS